MKIFAILILVAGLLSGCASQSPSSPKSAKEFTETQLGETGYRIDYKARATNSRKAKDKVLLRAAEVTQTQGYDWFIVTKRDSTEEEVDKVPSMRDEQFVTQSCGLLACRTQVQRVPGAHTIEDPFPEKDIHVILEIQMGKGIRPARDSYDVNETLEKFRVN